MDNLLQKNTKIYFKKNISYWYIKQPETKLRLFCITIIILLYHNKLHTNTDNNYYNYNSSNNDADGTGPVKPGTTDFSFIL